MMVKLTIAAIIASLAIIPAPVMTTLVDIPENLHNEYMCMKLALHYEARGEGTKGMIAVANVILNRANNSRFPSTICGVVKQRNKTTCQFSWVCDPRTSKKIPVVSQQAKKIAYRAVVEGKLRDITNGALFFHATSVNPVWSITQRFTAQIGNHIFYR